MAQDPRCLRGGRVGYGYLGCCNQSRDAQYGRNDYGWSGIARGWVRQRGHGVRLEEGELWDALKVQVIGSGANRMDGDNGDHCNRNLGGHLVVIVICCGLCLVAALGVEVVLVVQRVFG